MADELEVSGMQITLESERVLARRLARYRKPLD